MKRAALVLAALLFATSAQSDGLGNQGILGQGIFGGIGGGLKSSGPLPACGTGVIDLSTGCTLPIALGLVP